MHSRRKQRTYTVKEKQVAVLLVQDAEKLLDFKGPKTSKTLKGQGRKELFPGVAAIVTCMKDVRRDEKVIFAVVFHYNLFNFSSI
ncbi:hypothetical protein GQ600_1031 [Phytophthora cactorum]|nr:hypothetical protein GQ600_1031 [Phytophthora cactorum]